MRTRYCLLLYGIIIMLFFLGAMLFGGAYANVSTPLIFLVAGQSNAKGAADRPSSIIVPTGSFWNGDDWINIIKDPVFPAKHGSFCPAMAKVISDKTKRNVYIINVSVGGASSNMRFVKNFKKSWSKSGMLRERAVKIYKNAVKKIGGPYEFGGVVWLQGETEAKLLADGNITLDDVQSGFADVYHWLSNTFGKVFIIGIGYRNGNTRFDDTHKLIDRTIMQLADKIDNCYFASDLPIKLRELQLMQQPRKSRSSTPHYLIKGYDLVGEDVGNYIVDHMQ